jgi:hypothetical protein
MPVVVQKHFEGELDDFDRLASHWRREQLYQQFK